LASTMRDKDAELIRAEILELTARYARVVHSAPKKAVVFRPGETNVPYAGRLFDEEEVTAGVSSMLDFWLTLGAEGSAFEDELARYLGVRRCILTNSGSSANLLALAALTSHRLPKERRLRHGDEVITTAAGFPTTVAPILQVGAVPVFIDGVPGHGNAAVEHLERAYDPAKTRAVILAHALGNPFKLEEVLAFCRRHDLWLIEDNCDALGSSYSMPLEVARNLDLSHLLQRAELNRDMPQVLPRLEQGLLVAHTGSWGDLSTQSFYPPHHITMGEGGAVNVVENELLGSCVESFRDWGRDCWCPSGQDNTCARRFDRQLGTLPHGYDHKYTYSHLGYNLKPLDIQAAIGRVQLRKIEAFTTARKANWAYLRSRLREVEGIFEFTLPTHASAWRAGEFIWDDSGCRADCSWFGFMVTVRPGAGFSRNTLARHLDAQRIASRMFFGGNLVRQPAFVRLGQERPDAFRIVGPLAGADAIMERSLFLGTYPGLTSAMLEYVADTLVAFAEKGNQP